MERVEYESLLIQDLIGYHGRDELNIAPWYQRRSVWSAPQKSYLINTIHENKPVPSIYIRHTVDLENETSIKEVVDGQQRVRCVLEYKDGKFAARHPSHPKPVLYPKLSKKERVHFLQSTLSVGYLVGATDADVIEIFARINSVSKNLNPQEKRNARFSGEFKQFCLEEAVERLPFWRKNQIFSDGEISRMLEVQFVSDLIVNLLEGLQDFYAAKLSSIYGKYDDEFPHRPDVKKRLDRVYSIMLEMLDGLIGGSIFSAPQLLFSLMVALDSKRRLSVRKVKNCINDLNLRVEAVQSGEYPSALTTIQYEAFTSGNLHRIRSRRIRDKLIKTCLD